MEIGELQEIIQKLSFKYYGDINCLRLNCIKPNDDNTYVVDFKFKEGFIHKMQEPNFAKFRSETYKVLDKYFSSNCGKSALIVCGSGCHKCKERAYKMQFSEEVN